MTPERKREIEALFQEAIEQPPERRSIWLAQACGADDELREAVERLLDANDRTDGILDGPDRGLASLIDNLREAPPLNERIGAYRLVAELGRGGMGVVYLAERADDQFRQRVAVKVLRAYADSVDLVRRFLSERQILASLQHPNIATLLDGGVTPDGRPYLVLEYVEGEPIDVYCDRRRLPIEQRLRLFCTVARAVQHAHRNLVVHRDLKPSNILVTAEGEVKLLDFGIAKILDPAMLPDSRPLTRTGLRLMTPEYASPEQVRGDCITTATDIYGLGLILYELLTGHRPFRFTGRTPAEVERMICEADPPRLTTAVRWVEATAPGKTEQAITPETVSFARSTLPGRLRKRLSGDLERIVSMALRKEPERRYASAEQLAEDIERFQQRQPIVARGQSVPYRMTRFVGRHRWSVATAGAFLLLLGGYAATITVHERQVSLALERARLETEKAEQVTAFLMRLFEATDPGEVLTDTITARALLERGLQQAQLLEGQPAAQAQILDVVGRVYRYLGQYERAATLVERGLAGRRRIFGERHLAVAESHYNLAQLHLDLGQFDRAEAGFRSALALQRELLGADHAQVARTLDGLAMARRSRGDFAGAEPLAREALAMRRKLHGDEHPEIAESLSHVGLILRLRGDYADAEPLYRDALAMRRRLFGAEHPEVAQSLTNLGLQFQLQGNFEAAEPIYREALAMQTRLLGPEHPAVAVTLSNLAFLLRQRGKLDDAEPLYRRALEIRRKRFGAEHPEVARTLAHLGMLYYLKKEDRVAEPLLRDALALRRRVLGDEHPDVAETMNALGLVLRDRGDLEAADSLYRSTLAMRRRLLGEQHPEVASTLNGLGDLLRRRGDYVAAETLLVRALAMRRKLLKELHPSVTESLRSLAVLYESWGRADDAQMYRAMLRQRGDATASTAPGGTPSGSP